MSNESLSRVNLIYPASPAIGGFYPSKYSLGKHTGEKTTELPRHDASLAGRKKIPRYDNNIIIKSQNNLIYSYYSLILTGPI